MTKRQKEYKIAYDKMMQTPWKTRTCESGTKCWCRIIEPIRKITYSEVEEIYIAPSGSIYKNTAKYIVKLHNEKLKERK